MDEEKIEYILGGISAIHGELEELNKWLHRLYNVQMMIVANDEPAIFEKLNLVHNDLNMFMEDNWEKEVEEE